MKLKARCYSFNEGYLTECPEIGVSARGGTFKESVKKMCSILKRHFDVIFVDAEVDDDGLLLTLF